jgi:predicted metalloprotease
MSIGGVGGGIGVGTIVLAVIGYFLGIDPSTVINTAQQVNSIREEHAPQQKGHEGAPTDQLGGFVSKVLGSTEDVWTQIFQQSGKRYRNPTLVLYTQATRSACGLGQSAMGPFYCPNDEKLYVDLAFFNDLRTRFHAPGEFAEAYVVAHEIGHHVQKQLGIMQKLQSLQGQVSKTEFNRASVRIELQADCFAGVWAHFANARGQLDAGEFEQGLQAASAIGDDRLQKQAQGYVVPDSFTHGSSAQRVRWFKRGMDSGKMSECDTFAAQSL